MTTTKQEPKARHVAGSSKKYVLLQYPRAYCKRDGEVQFVVRDANWSKHPVIGCGFSGSAAWANAADRLFSRAS